MSDGDERPLGAAERWLALSLAAALAGFVTLVIGVSGILADVLRPAETPATAEAPAAVRFAVEHGGGDVHASPFGEVVVVGDAATGLCYAVYVYYPSGAATLGPVPCE